MSLKVVAKVQVKCAFCSADLWRKRNAVENSRSGLFFCNREHAAEAAKATSSIPYKTGPEATTQKKPKHFVDKVCLACGSIFKPNVQYRRVCNEQCKRDYLTNLTAKTCVRCLSMKPLNEFYAANTIDKHSNRCKSCDALQWKEWKAKDPSKAKQKNMASNRKYDKSLKGKATMLKKKLNKYGLDNSAYNTLLQKYDGKCHICKQATATHVDHDHNTQKVRGILCRSCNIGLGFLGDSLEGVLAAAEYLRNC